MQLITNVLGSFVIRNGKLIMQRQHPKDVTKTARILELSLKKTTTDEIELLDELIRTGNKVVDVENPLRFQGLGLDIKIGKAADSINVYEIGALISFSEKEVDQRIGLVNEAIVREQIKRIEKDQILIQAVNSLDDIDEAVNRLVERLREWYSLHFPELDPIIAPHRNYAQIVSKVGLRKDYNAGSLGFDTKLNDRICSARDDSLGVPFNEADIKAIKEFAEPINHLFLVKDSIEQYITNFMGDIAPNLSAVAGPLVGARLISLAHSLDRLARLPAGTIQVLGAEDAFFRFLKSGKKPPKHGIIFQHPDIRSAGKNIRGKLSRTLAAKIAIAARADAYKGNYIAPKLVNQFKNRVKQLKK